MATIGFSKVFILDKYFTELQKFWETEKKLQGMQMQDATSSNEAAHLQQRLKNLSSELVTLRNRLHVNNNGQQGMNGSGSQPAITSSNNANNNSTVNNSNNIPGIIPIGGIAGIRHSQHPTHVGHPVQHVSQGESYTNKPLPPHPPPINNNNNNLNHNSNLLNNSNNNHHNVHHNNQHNANNGYYVNQHFPKDVMRVNGSNAELIIGGPQDDKASGSLIGTVTTANSASGGDATPSESSFKLLSSSMSGSGTSVSKVRLADIEDLIHLYGPLTEDALIRCLQARCAANKHHIYMGPNLVLANPFTAVGNALTLSSTKAIPTPPPIQKIVQEALRQQADTSFPQAIILSGSSGSGKTYTSMLVLRQLFEVAGGGSETDAFKHLMASITVLRSLGTARTVSNSESSRIGHFIEVQVTDGTVYRTKLHCYFLDQNRVVRVLPGERNYHIFYQMLAGLNPEERAKLHLGEHTVRTIRYLSSAAADRGTDEAEDARRFLDWKASLGVLGIPFLDVVRVLAAVILIGNVQFVESACMEVDVEGNAELQAAAALLGVSETALKQGLTTRTHNVRNQLVRSRCDANLSNFARDALAKSLYCRTVATIVRRANSLKRLTSTSGTLSSDSTDSVHNQAETQSQHASTVGTAGSKASKSMTALNNAVRHLTDGFVGILDMFGFEDVKPSHLEHLCINLCAETMQHFYNTHSFKACIESCRDEGIQCDWEVDYVDNVPCIDLISSLRSGLLSMLDVECSMRGTVESYVQKVRQQHKQSPRFLETKSADLRSFAIQHYAGKVQYNATDFLETNRDILADDLVAVFHKHRCSFGFASHLFSSELKILGAGGMEPSPRGISFRISPTSHTELLNGDEPVSTLTQDFHTRLDNLLRTLVHTRPHFIRCIKLNQNELHDSFDRHTVSKQLRAFQVLETINLMAHGYPHRMRFKVFNARYRLLAPFHQLSRTDDRAVEDCQFILECCDKSLDGSLTERLGHISISHALGKRHVFMSEGARQKLEALRVTTRNRAATLIQSTWRGWHCRQRWPIIQHGSHLRLQHALPANHPNNPIPIAPPTMMHNSGIAPANQVNLLANNQSSNSAISGTGNNAIYRNGVLVSPNAASSMGNLHTLQSHATASGGPQISSGIGTNDLVSPSCSSPPPIIPVPAPRTTIMTNGNSGINNSLATSPPAIPTLNTTSVATISLVNSSNNGASGGVSSNTSTAGGRPRPQPISGTPPPDVMDRCDPKLVQQTCNLFGLDMERPPPLPPARSYTVAGNTKLGYPQTRVMKMSYQDEALPSDFRLLKGETVMVIGASTRRGHLLVEHKNRTIHIPFQYLELKSPHPEG
ncbi:unnamed protein product [Allacma fusca]|uniref:Myosin motor domain-containing protein n=1 Tax=Allacma fusca TaxID=39272 RepID=A0A8J2LJE3_9HEXA|nr:unnamed protein product [Allacma fusca]